MGNSTAIEASTVTANAMRTALGPRASRWARRCAMALLAIVIALSAIGSLVAHADINFLRGEGSNWVYQFNDGSTITVGPLGDYVSDSGSGQAASYIQTYGKGRLTNDEVSQRTGEPVNIQSDTTANRDGSSFFDSILAPWADALFETAAGVLFTLASSDLLVKPFNALFGENTWVYQAIITINQTVAVPTAHSVLAMMIMVQIFSIARRASSGDVLPGFKDIAILAIFFVCFSWAINHSMEICDAIYTAFVDMITQVQAIATGSTTGSLPDIDAGGGGMMGVKLIIGVLLLLAGIVAYVATTAVLLARSLQIYIMAMFSPIPLALLGSDLTRSMGIGFLKNFVSACLAGVIIMLLIMLYPALYGGVLSDAFSLGEGFMGCMALLALPTLMTMGMAKSGSWAKELLGS